METLKKRKIAVYYPFFMGGGAEAVGLWILEALKGKYDLTLFTTTPVNFERLNSMYGTSLSSEWVTVKALIPNSLRSACHFLIANSADFRMLCLHLLVRYFKANSHQYDLVSSAFNAIDLGKKGIQYIHWIKVVEGTPFYRSISGFSQDQIKENISIANSYCVADSVKKTYEVDSTVVYPPVVIDAPMIPWEEKENAFICSGRLVPAKQPHKVIQILRAVRKRGFDIKLHMTGGGGGTSEWKYQRWLKDMVKKNSSWVTLYENLKYKDYVNVVSRCRYGIHYKQEPFGISIAEMVKAGAIPFVKSKGGQIEIVGEHNQALFFDDDEDAVEKIVRILSDQTQQDKALKLLEEQRNLFSTHRFVTEINAVVDSYFEAESKE
jgi:glycosyltransferase involved in cell wall biosynthesis